ncbi:PAS domain S-box-containing protein [Winogradskyella pacifica]|uniref:histidine kinase n=1 Tax=Winogradskyella pacifica TaxID=664642 RepID=A0A3D9LMV5_9FLAO|nr:PAS domain-containing sensor histidine kinase [Winogradskyella pacifica]REE07717.1 PAS domain S-box-containing protein [Winogradskyella pacifica]
MSSGAEHNLRAKAEAKIRERSQAIQNLTLEESKSLLHELEVHQVELEMQNEELREAQHRLEEVRDQYTDLFDFAPIGYLVLNEKAIIINSNLTACDLLGIERSYIIGKPFSAYITNGESRTLFLNLRKAFETGILPSFEIKMKHKSKGEFTVLLQGTITKNKISESTVCRVSLIDVSELKKAEILQLQHKSLQKEKEKIQEYLNLAPVVFLLIDTEYNVQLINKKGCDLLGYNSIEILGKNWLNNFISLADGKGSILSYKYIKNENGLLNPNFESFLKCNNNNMPLMSWTNLTLLDENKKYIGTLIAGEDITERKKLESRRQKYTEELEDIVAERTKELKEALQQEKIINEMKSAFVSMASHEFRTPLTSILSSTILIEKYNELNESTKVKRHVDRIKSSVNQLTNILKDFLSMEKLERGIVTTSKENFTLKVLIKDIIEDLHWMFKENQKINYVEKGSIEVFMDKKILRNILINLISNATKYSQTDIQITAFIKKNVLFIEIEDRGIGIPENEQKYLFTKFFRAKNVSNIQGTGLGLSIVKHYVNLLEGTITFISKIGEGSTFKLAFPLCP